MCFVRNKTACELNKPRLEYSSISWSQSRQKQKCSLLLLLLLFLSICTTYKQTHIMWSNVYGHLTITPQWYILTLSTNFEAHNYVGCLCMPQHCNFLSLEPRDLNLVQHDNDPVAQSTEFHEDIVELHLHFWHLVDALSQSDIQSL